MVRWIGALRPSRRPLRGLLRVWEFIDDQADGEKVAQFRYVRAAPNETSRMHNTSLWIRKVRYANVSQIPADKFTSSQDDLAGRLAGRARPRPSPGQAMLAPGPAGAMLPVWRRTLPRRRRKDRSTWKRIEQLADDFLPNPASFTPGRASASPLNTRGESPMRESRTYGSVRGASSNGCPYRDAGLDLPPSDAHIDPAILCK